MTVSVRLPTPSTNPSLLMLPQSSHNRGKLYGLKYRQCGNTNVEGVREYGAGEDIWA